MITVNEAHARERPPEEIQNIINDAVNYINKCLRDKALAKDKTA